MYLEIEGIVMIRPLVQGICPVGGSLRWQFQLYFGVRPGWLCPIILLGCVSLVQWNVCSLLGIWGLGMSMFEF